jgi:hypothetical protein
MTLNQLICRAASAYPEAYVLQYWDMEKQEPKHNPVGGDTLAQFIAQELADTFDGEAGETQQINEAVRVIQSAADDLAAVACVLGELATERKGGA